eukprot:m.868470 g.868470  ORF g.868470 m.868470 type:complete len:88 (+) comp23562_c0_seq10:412-675(+)
MPAGVRISITIFNACTRFMQHRMNTTATQEPTSTPNATKKRQLQLQKSRSCSTYRIATKEGPKQTCDFATKKEHKLAVQCASNGRPP